MDTSRLPKGVVWGRKVLVREVKNEMVPDADNILTLLLYHTRPRGGYTGSHGPPSRFLLLHAASCLPGQLCESERVTGGR